MKKILYFLFFFCLIVSCESAVYYYENKDFYGILKKNELTYYYSGYMREFDSDRFFKVYEETNGWQMLDLDSLAKALNAENKEKGNGPFYSFEERVKVNLIDNGIIYEHLESRQIDTFKLNKRVYQNNKKLPFPKYFINSSATFNQGAPLKHYKNNFALQYVKDSLFHYSDQEIEIVHIFYLYPRIYSPGGGFEKLLDTSSYSNPIIVGISSTSGVPVYAATSKTFYDENHFIKSINCYNWIKIKGVSRKKIELLLR